MTSVSHVEAWNRRMRNVAPMPAQLYSVWVAKQLHW
jgi:hypothetical protein